MKRRNVPNTMEEHEMGKEMENDLMKRQIDLKLNRSRLLNQTFPARQRKMRSK